MEPADVTMFNTLFSFLLLRNKKYGALIYTLHRTPNWKLKLFKHFDRIYCGSDAVKFQALKLSPAMKNIKRVYNCIEISDGFPTKKAEKGRLTFIYVGRFVKDKGLEPLIKGFEKSLRLFPSNRLLTLGPQKDEEGGDTHFFHSMLRFTKAHGLDRPISFLPPMYDKKSLYSRINDSDVVCIPSLWGETFSMAVLEAMMLAKPVLVSDFGPMPEAVEHLRTGFITRAGDADSICEAVEYFSRNHAKLEQMGKAAKDKALSEFSCPNIAQEYLEDFRNLIKRKSPGKG
jgi:glycosyltransferase involved in cell wall biosynthesis